MQLIVHFQQVTYRFWVVMVTCGVANHTVANQTVSWKKEGVVHLREQHFFGFRKEPFNGNVTEDWRHGFLQRLYHLWNEANVKDSFSPSTT